MDTLVKKIVLKRVLGQTTEKQFPRCHALSCDTVKKHAESAEGKEIDESAQIEETHVTLQQVRVALLKDTYEYLSSFGYEMTVFTSVDGDELHVCVALRDEASIRHLLTSHGYRLQA